MSAKPRSVSPEAVVAGRSGRMRDVLDFVAVIAGGDSSVLITGESGTGKELIANLIHASSPHRPGPFVAVSCAILTEALIESELFGHERGTVFLDDIDTVPITIQVKLLRALQATGMRVIAGATRDVRKMVAAGEFREDLFYRLNVIPIHLPPLRDWRRRHSRTGRTFPGALLPRAPQAHAPAVPVDARGIPSSFLARQRARARERLRADCADVCLPHGRGRLRTMERAVPGATGSGTRLRRLPPCSAVRSTNACRPSSPS